MDDSGKAHAHLESDKVALEPMGSNNTADHHSQDQDGSLSPTSLEDAGRSAKQIQYLTGIRFHLIIAACVAVFPSPLSLCRRLVQLF